MTKQSSFYACIFLLFSVLSFAQKAPFSIQYGHQDLVSDIVFSTDGGQLISGDSEGVINIWDVESGYNIHTINDLPGSVELLALSQNQKYLLAVLDNAQDKTSRWPQRFNQVAILNLEKKEIIGNLEIPLEQRSQLFLGFHFLQADNFIIGWTSSTIIIWNTTYQLEKVIDLKKEERSINLIPNTGKFLSLDSNNKKFRIYSLFKEQPIEQFAIPNDMLTNRFINISPNGDAIIYVDTIGRTVISNLLPSKSKRYFSFPKTKYSLRDLAHVFNNDGKYVVSVGYSTPPFTMNLDSVSKKYNFFRDVCVWEFDTGKVIHQFKQFKNTRLYVKFSTNRTLALFGGGRFLPTLQLWDWKNGKLLKDLRGKVGKVTVLAKNNAESILAFSDIDYPVIKLLDLRTLTSISLKDKQLVSYDIYGEKIPSVGAVSLDFSREGKQLISSNWSNKIYVWNLEKYNLDKTIVSSSNNEVFNYICFGNEKGQIISGGEYEPLPEKSFFERQNDLTKELKVRDSLGYFGDLNKRKGKNIFESHISKKQKQVKLKKWDTEQEKSVSFENLHNDIFLTQYIPAKNQLATIDYSKGVPMVAWWDMSTRKQIDFLPMDYADSNNRVFAISEKGSFYARGLEDGKIEIYEENGYKTEFKVPSAVSSLAFDAAEMYLAVGQEDDYQITIWDIKNRRKIKTLKGHWNVIQHLTFLEQQNLLVSCSIDGNMIFWDWQKEELLCYYVSLKDYGEGVIVSKNNFYKSTKNGVQSIVLTINNRSFPFEQFDLKLNRPDKVLAMFPNSQQKIISAYHKAYQKRLKKLNFTEAMLSEDFHVPELKITTDKLPIATSESQLHIDINASDTQQKLDRINVYINDVPIYGINGINLRPQNIQNWEQTLNLTLSKGENKIQVSILNQGGAESLKETIYITYDAPKTKNNLYLIGVGIERFKNSKLNLSYPIKDIRDMVDLYQQKANQYNNIYVDTLFNKNISLEHLQTIKQKLQNSKVDDQVVLFVAGHGILDDSLDYYLATYDTDFSNLTTKGIAYEQLENLLDSIPARQKLFLMDACHSGEIDKESVALIRQQNTTQKDLKLRSFENQPIPTKLGLDNSFELMKELFVDLRRGTGATVISSASGVEFAREGDKWQNSVFAYALLSGLEEQKADLNEDGKVMVSELQKYVTNEVSVLTDNHQKPTMRLENISNDWQIW